MDKKALHRDVLSTQQVLDFDTYVKLMTLLNTYVDEVTFKKNEETFETRIELL